MSTNEWLTLSSIFLSTIIIIINLTIGNSQNKKLKNLEIYIHKNNLIYDYNFKINKLLFETLSEIRFNFINFSFCVSNDEPNNIFLKNYFKNFDYFTSYFSKYSMYLDKEISDILVNLYAELLFLNKSLKEPGYDFKKNLSELETKFESISTKMKDFSNKAIKNFE